MAKSAIANRHTFKPRNEVDPRFYSLETRIRNDGLDSRYVENYVKFNPDGTNMISDQTMSFFKKATLKVKFSTAVEVYEMGKWESFSHEKERVERIGRFKAYKGDWFDDHRKHYEILEQNSHLPRTKYYGYPYIYDQETLDATAKNEEMTINLIDNRGVLIKPAYRPYARYE
jgi:hypothetical protein